MKKFYAGFPFYSLILRDLTNIFFKEYAVTTHKKMGRLAKLGHDVWYVLFRYFSLKQRGDVFICLFDRKPARAGLGSRQEYGQVRHPPSRERMHG